MDIALSVTLGLLFVLAGLAFVFVLFRLWGHLDRHNPDFSKAPRGLARLHLIFFIIYAALYAVMMVEMLPRLSLYQVELPPRSAVHVSLGFFVGALILVKLSILTLFRHLALFLPQLSTVLLGCTILLIGLSVPGGLREYGLARRQVGGSVYSVENRERVARLLPAAGMPAEAPLPDLSTVESLRSGRAVLATKCVVCHDLKTILGQPRSPSGWWGVVERMAEKPNFDEPMTERELWEVTSYLIAITGDLQKSARQQRAERLKQQQAIGTEEGAGAPAPYDAGAAQKAYEAICSQCHDLGEVDKKPPSSAKEVREVIERMVADNGLSAPPRELDLAYAFMLRKFAPGEVASAPATLGAAVGAEVAAAMGGGNAPDIAKEPEEGGEAVPTDSPPEGGTPEGTPEGGEKPAAPAKPKPKSPAKPAIDGKPLYLKFCAPCHEADGKGKPGLKSKNIPDMTAKDWQKKHSKASVIKVLKTGVPGTVMKAFDTKLKPEEIEAVAAFVKKLR